MPDTLGMIAIIAKLLLYVGVAGVSGLVIIRTAYPDLTDPLKIKMHYWAMWLALLALITAVAGFMLRGASLTGGVDGVVDPEILELLWQTPVGDALLYRVTGATIIIVGLLIPDAGKWIALAGSLIALWSFTQIGHVPDMETFGLRILLLLHLVGISFWVGILVPLHTFSRLPNQIENAALLGHRFGQAAAAIVPVLVLAGLLMAWLLVGDIKDVCVTARSLYFSGIWPFSLVR